MKRHGSITKEPAGLLREVLDGQAADAAEGEAPAALRRPRFVRSRWPRTTAECSQPAPAGSSDLEPDTRAIAGAKPAGSATPSDGSVPGPGRHARQVELLTYFTGPAAGAATAYVLSVSGSSPIGDAAIVLAVLLIGQRLVAGDVGPARLLPLMGHVLRLALPLCWLVLVVGLQLLGRLPEITTGEAALVVLIAAVFAGAAERLGSSRTVSLPLRIAIVGASGQADSLDRELRLSRFPDRYEIVGRISFPGDKSPLAHPLDEVEVLGRLGGLPELVARHEIGLLIMTGEVPRIAVFDEVVRSCLHLPVRVREMSSFYEEAFGHVATTEINAAWFQYLMHPNYRTRASVSERLLDVVGSALLGLVALPVLGLVGLIIRRDGGPVLFRQSRIGEGGHPFTLYKLRTMRPDNSDTSWAGDCDPRVTPIGRFLRRTHLDELPQLLNVLKGEMSLVGPRPEQPRIVDELEQSIPIYQRRQLIKPGLTGWAQVRCGYAGSETGSAWKLSHDLFYLKHRSFWHNVLILAETVRVVVADPQYTAQPASVAFILAPQDIALAPVLQARA